MKIPTRVFASILVVVAVVGGCSKDDDPDVEQPPSPTGAPASSADARGAAERDAVAAYRGMWDAFVAAGKTADPDAAALRTYASDDALKLIVTALLQHRQNQQVILGELVIDPKPTEVRPADAPTEVMILDCVNDEDWLVYKASGGLADDEPGGKHQTTAVVTRSGGAWKVKSFELGRSGTC
ncbi:hypothetical protein GCM10009557_01150 [Virgisporangium ochraceum]|uniref:Secreted protein/lipoprotein n=1 Tax=Virgisporangium ochraceum TaxID=65505 RepID=A0A8J4A2X8_9ACTN|nr:hypothetical protein [Virgisporangium ochraceum]GIJ74146.1 hypothetical protein Voc01_090630 [Virgisporangium ochraceum]